MDECLEAVYDSDRSAGLGSSAPKVSRWLGDIREFFPQSVVQVIQRDAVSRLHLHELLTEPVDARGSRTLTFTLSSYPHVPIESYTREEQGYGSGGRPQGRR